jgi:UDP-N-acetyl-D-mannosaminuronate dehydrogenase
VITESAANNSIGGIQMAAKDLVLVVGLGEVGNPLLHLLSRTYNCVGVDIEPVSIDSPCSVLHICYPFQAGDFVATTASYIYKYRPALTIINSTVAPGTTRKVQEAADNYLVAYSPIRGKHIKMESDMLHYKKFVGALYDTALDAALAHFSRAGFHTETFSSPELGELSKLLETTYLGVLIAWAQEMERLAAHHGGTFDEVNSFIEEIAFLPSHIFPGKIGGHCVLPNIAILRSYLESAFLDLVVESNNRKERLIAAATEIGHIHDNHRTDRARVLGA